MGAKRRAAPTLPTRITSRPQGWEAPPPGLNQDGKFFDCPRYTDPLIEQQALKYLADAESSDAPVVRVLALTVPRGPCTPMTPFKHLPLRGTPAK